MKFQNKKAIVDLTMPRLDGEECFREILKIRKNAKVVIISGYNEQEVSLRFSGKGLAGFVQKPFRLTTLQSTVQSIWGAGY